MKRFLAIIAMLLIITTALASIQGPTRFEADCFEEAIITEYTITNEFNQRTEFSLSISGGKNSFDYYLRPEKITLNAGETGSFYLFISPCCWAKPGTYTLDLRATSIRGDFTRKIDFTILESRILVLEIEPRTIRLGQCEEGTATIKIENNGPIAETIELSLETDYPDTFSITSEEVRVNAGSSREIDLKAIAPCKTTVERRNVTVNAVIKGTQLGTSARFTADLIDKQRIELEEKYFEACNDVDETKNITIKNPGRADDTVSLSIEGPGWIELKQENIALKAGEEREIGIEFKKTDAEGNFEFKIIAFSEKYNKTTEQEYEGTIKDCYNVSIEFLSGKTLACIEDQTLYYEYKLENQRETEIILELSVSGIKATLDKTRVTLRPRATKTIEAVLDLEGETPGKKEVEFRITSDKFTDSIKTTLELEDCYALSVDSSAIRDTIKMEVSPQLCPTSRLLELSATNIGTKGQEATLLLTGIHWAYLEPQKLTLQPGETKPFYIFVSPPVTEKEGIYTAELSVKAREFSTTIPLKVEIISVTLPEKIGIEAEAEIEETIVEEERTVRAKIRLANTSDCPLEISEITSKKYNATFRPAQFTMQENETIEITATIYLGRLDLNVIEMPVEIHTDRGIIHKNISINLAEQIVSEIDIEEPEPEKEAPAPHAIAGPTSNIIVLVFLAIVATAIVVLAYYAYAKEQGKGKGKGKKGKPVISKESSGEKTIE